MKNTTLRVIIILLFMLFLNIEAAQAGLTQKWRYYILHEFPDYQWLYICIGLLFVSFVAYVVFVPVAIGKEKWAWLNYPDYSSKKNTVSRISSILNAVDNTKTVHK